MTSIISIYVYFIIVIAFLTVDCSCNLIRQLHVTESGHLKLDSTQDCTKGEGYFPNDVDCTRFYRCVNESRPNSSTVTVLKRYDFVCGSGTVYDSSEQICTFGNCNGKNETTVDLVSPSGGMAEENPAGSGFMCPEFPAMPSDFKCIAPPCEFSNPCKPDEHCCPYYNVGGRDCQTMCHKKNMSTTTP